MKHAPVTRALAGGSDRHLIIGVVALGVLIRTMWNVFRYPTGASGEAANVAAAWASGRGFADSFAVGQGATAHLLPVTPLVAGVVYRLLGTKSLPAEVLLASWSIGLAMATYLLMFDTFRRLGTPRWSRLAALAVALLLPIYIKQEAVDFRIWEGGLAGFLAAAIINRFAAYRDADPGSAEGLLSGIAAVSGLLFFVDPPLGLGALAGIGASLLIERRHRALVRFAVLAAAVIALLVGSWAYRNERALGAAILLRSDAGLELALANYPGALGAGDRRILFMNRWTTIHPAVSPAAYAAMVRAGGELAYSDALLRNTRRWVAAHPGQTGALMLVHMRQLVAPEPWQFRTFGNPFLPTLRSIIAGLVAFAGLIGLSLGWAGDRRRWTPIVVMLAVTVVAMSPFQPILRYPYLLYAPLLFASAHLAGLLRKRFRRDFAPGIKKRSLANEAPGCASRSREPGMRGGRARNGSSWKFHLNLLRKRGAD